MFKRDNARLLSQQLSAPVMPSYFRVFLLHGHYLGARKRQADVEIYHRIILFVSTSYLRHESTELFFSAVKNIFFIFQLTHSLDFRWSSCVSKQ